MVRSLVGRQQGRTEGRQHQVVDERLVVLELLNDEERTIRVVEPCIPRPDPTGRRASDPVDDPR